MYEVQSNSIQAIGYEGTRMVVDFHDGSRYYVACGHEVFNALLTAPSVGAYYNRHVRHAFPAVQVREAHA